MTIDELNQLQYLKKFISHERERLATMRESLDVKSPIISDMPKARGSYDRIGDTVPEIVDETAALDETIRTMEKAYQRLINYIQQIKNMRVRLIITLRYIDGKSWNDVADYMDNGDGKCTAENMRMAVKNYLKREERHKK